MIIREFYKTRSDGVNLYRVYSNSGYIIKQLETGNTYIEAVDIESSEYTYEETDELISKDEMYEMRLKALESSIDIITGQE